jgi:hypothetical protein
VILPGASGEAKKRVRPQSAILANNQCELGGQKEVAQAREIVGRIAAAPETPPLESKLLCPHSGQLDVFAVISSFSPHLGRLALENPWSRPQDDKSICFAQMLDLKIVQPFSVAQATNSQLDPSTVYPVSAVEALRGVGAIVERENEALSVCA